MFFLKVSTDTTRHSQGQTTLLLQRRDTFISLFVVKIAIMR